MSDHKWYYSCGTFVCDACQLVKQVGLPDDVSVGPELGALRCVTSMPECAAHDGASRAGRIARIAYGLLQSTRSHTMGGVIDKPWPNEPANVRHRMQQAAWHAANFVDDIPMALEASFANDVSVSYVLLCLAVAKELP